MSTNEMLRRSISYEESVLRNYRQYAIQAQGTEIGDLFSKLVEDKTKQLETMKSMFKRYCKT